MKTLLCVATLGLLLLSGCQRTESPAQTATPAAATPNEWQPAAEGAMCGGFAGVACQEGLYCAMEAGRCTVADDAGTCRRAPEVCTREYAPVCGCDGKTYGNACTAAMEGAKIDKPGECG